jgi:hypothetical protein
VLLNAATGTTTREAKRPWKTGRSKGTFNHLTFLNYYEQPR